MASDFTVIMSTRAHLGNESGLFGDVPFVGPEIELPLFSCPNVDRSQRAVLLFQTSNVHSPFNVIRINGSALFGGIPVNSTGGDQPLIWNGNVALVEANVLTESGNRLFMASRNLSGTGGGNIDDFVIDNIVIFFKTR